MESTKGSKMTEQTVRETLDRVAQTHAAMIVHGCYPSGYKSCMPDYAKEWWSAYNTTPAYCKTPPPTMEQITEWEKVTNDWVIPFAKYCRENRMPYVAYALQKSLILRPETMRRKLSNRRIARIMGASHTAVNAWIRNGYKIMAKVANGDVK